jgi:hypothetical protein
MTNGEDDDDGNDRKNEDRERWGGARQRPRPSTRPHRCELLLAGCSTITMDDDDGDTWKPKPNNDEGTTRVNTTIRRTGRTRVGNGEQQGGGTATIRPPQPCHL